MGSIATVSTYMTLERGNHQAQKESFLTGHNETLR